MSPRTPDTPREVSALLASVGEPFVERMRSAHAVFLPRAKGQRQELFLPGGNDSKNGAWHNTPMANDEDQLYIAEWLEATGKKAADIARGGKVSNTYISQLIAGSKDNPSQSKLKAIADGLGVPLKALYDPPPSREAWGTLRALLEPRSENRPSKPAR